MSTHNFLDNKKSAKAIERSTFASTCNLLTQYLKEKGNLKDFSRSMTSTFEALGKSRMSQIAETSSTKNLFYSLGDLNEPPTEETRHVDYLPQYTTVDCTNKTNTSKEAISESKSAQMTIFYNGRVLVFDSVPAEKAQELMVLVSRESKSHLAKGNLSTTSRGQRSNIVGAVTSTSTPPLNHVVSTFAKEKAQVQSDTNDSDLPIARRSSLNRILEKRRERSSSRAPYQVGNDAPGPSSKNDDQLELKL